MAIGVDEIKSERLEVRMTCDERASAYGMAADDGLTASEFVRSLIRRERERRDEAARVAKSERDYYQPHGHRNAGDGD